MPHPDSATQGGAGRGGRMSWWTKRTAVATATTSLARLTRREEPHCPRLVAEARRLFEVWHCPEGGSTA